MFPTSLSSGQPQPGIFFGRLTPDEPVTRSGFSAKHYQPVLFGGTWEVSLQFMNKAPVGVKVVTKV